MHWPLEMTRPAAGPRRRSARSGRRATRASTDAAAARRRESQTKRVPAVTRSASASAAASARARPRRGPRVGVHADDEVTRRRLDALLERPGLADPARGRLPALDDARRRASARRGGAVARAVVDDEDLGDVGSPPSPARHGPILPASSRAGTTTLTGRAAAGTAAESGGGGVRPRLRRASTATAAAAAWRRVSIATASQRRTVIDASQLRYARRHGPQRHPGARGVPREGPRLAGAAHRPRRPTSRARRSTRRPRSSPPAAPGRPELTEGGLNGVTWPAEYGGQGLGPLHQVVANQEIGRAGVPGILDIIGVGMLGPTIIAHGTEEQKHRCLGRC